MSRGFNRLGLAALAGLVGMSSVSYGFEDDMNRSYSSPIPKHRRTKYPVPHQGKKECMRRLKQGVGGWYAPWWLKLTPTQSQENPS